MIIAGFDNITNTILIVIAFIHNRNSVIGIIIALCCHQLCRYHMFPYHEYLQDSGITENDFKRICAMSSWAICGQRPTYEKGGDSNDNEDNDDHAYNEENDEEIN